jgi:hypothetical protein
MTGAIAALAGANPRFINFDDASVSRVSASGLASATYQIRSTGFVWSTDPSSGTLVQGAQWVVPTTEVSAYEVFATVTSGALSNGTTGSWVALSSNRSWDCVIFSNDPATRSATLAFQIRRIGTTDVLDTWTVSIFAEVT